MIAGVDRSGDEPRAEVFGEDAAAGRAWCYASRSRSLYECDGRLVTLATWYGTDVVAAVERGDLLTTWRNRPRRRAA